MSTLRTHFTFRVDTWTPDGESIVEHIAAVEDYQVTLATYRTACERWPGTPITLRQGARVIEDSRRLRVVWSDKGRQGGRHIKAFERKKDADACRGQVTVDVGLGVHTAPSKSLPVREAGDLWLETGENNELERATLDSHEQHLRLHIVPLLGNEKLTALTTAAIRAFEDKLRQKGLSPVMRRRVIVSLGSLLADAQERGFVGQNVVRSLRASRKGDRHKRREVAKLKIAHLKGRWRPLLLTAVLACAHPNSGACAGKMSISSVAKSTSASARTAS